MNKQLSISLVIDEEVQGYTKEIHSVDGLKEMIGALLDQRVLEVRIVKKKDCQSNPISNSGSTDGLLNIDYHK